MKKNKTIVSPPVFRPQPAPKVVQGKTPAPKVKPLPTVSSQSIQRICKAPGCTDPDCHDESNHGFDRVIRLRGRNIYHGRVGRSAIGKGSGTSKGTRKYVNSPGTPYPKQVSVEYSGGVRKPGRGGSSEFINQPLAKGQRADAGHIFGRQFGGIGKQNASVFPQHPQTNRGNYHKGQPTRHLWRAHEDAIRSSAQSGKKPAVSVTLRDEPRISYERWCRHCLAINPIGVAVCVDCGHVL